MGVGDARIQPPESIKAPQESPGASPAVRHGSDEAAIAADVDRLTAAALEGFNGPAWEALVEHLYLYAVNTFNKWLRTGAIFGQLFARGLSEPTRWHPPLTAEERDDLARDVVVLSLQRFRDNVLKQKKWDPTLGTQLRTYFVTYCLFYFMPLYRKLLNRLDTQLVGESLDDHFDDSAFASERPDVRAADRHQLRTVLGCVEPTPADIVLLAVWLEDQPLQVAADRLDITYKAAERRRARLRDRLATAISA